MNNEFNSQVKARAMSIDEYELAQPHGRVIAALIMLGGLVELICFIGWFEVPMSIRAGFGCLTCILIGIIIGKDLRIWKKKY